MKEYEIERLSNYHLTLGKTLPLHLQLLFLHFHFHLNSLNNVAFQYIYEFEDCRCF